MEIKPSLKTSQYLWMSAHGMPSSSPRWWPWGVCPVWMPQAAGTLFCYPPRLPRACPAVTVSSVLWCWLSTQPKVPSGGLAHTAPPAASQLPPHPLGLQAHTERWCLFLCGPTVPSTEDFDPDRSAPEEPGPKWELLHLTASTGHLGIFGKEKSLPSPSPNGNSRETTKDLHIWATNI